MKYVDDYKKMKAAFASDEALVEFDNISISKFPFRSSAYNLLPGNDDYYCAKHDRNFHKRFTYQNDIGDIHEDIFQKDDCIAENRDFEYHVLNPCRNSKKVKKAIFLFHGFNEKNWEKYLVWGKYIAEKTQSAVIYFPIGFHMQRAPMRWSSKKEMFKLSEERKKKYPNIINSSLANIAISMRLHSMPQRFFWSGLQTYYDVIKLLENIKAGEHPLIDKNFSFDIFAYSIGGFLAQILKLANYKNYFDRSKVCLFCSGAVFNRLSPVSKFIIDSEANVALYSYLVEHFDSFLQKDPFLYHYIEEDHIEGKVFHAMLDYQKMREVREKLLRKAQDDIYAVSLKQDSVIPTFEIMNTLHGAFRDIDIAVDEVDFDYEYTHENPFPVKHKDQQKIDKCFKMTFDKVCNFFMA